MLGSGAGFGRHEKGASGAFTPENRVFGGGGLPVQVAVEAHESSPYPFEAVGAQGRPS